MGKKPSRTTFRDRLDEMVSTLRQDIITGKRPVGEYLPSELALGEQFRLSKNSVRKGLEILVEEGLLVKQPRIGNMVNRPPSENRIQLKFGYYPSMIQEAQLTQLVELFHQQYPHIKVQMIPLPYDTFGETVTGYFSNDLLDVVSINYTDYEKLFEKDQLEIFEELDEISNIYPFLKPMFQHNGYQMVMPFIFSPVVLCYNKKHFSEQNLSEPDSSWSWYNLKEASEKLVEAGSVNRYGFYFHLLSLNRWPIFLLQSGMKFDRDANGKWKIRGTKLLESMHICRDLIFDQRIFPAFLSESDADAESLFLQEKVSMIMTTYFSLNNLKDAEFPFEIAPLPFFQDARTLLLIIGLAINKHSPRKDEAKAFIRFLLSPEAQRIIRQKTLSIPALKSAAEWTGKEFAYRPSRFHMYREIIPTFRLITDLQLPIAGMESLRDSLKLFWSGLEDEDALCNHIENIK